MGTKESETITHEVTSKVYRKRLGQAFTGGDLEMADSKAAFLQNLCEELRFDPLKAKEVHAGNRSCFQFSFLLNSVFQNFDASALLLS